MSIVKVSNLNKKYLKKADFAVKDLSFEVGGGEIVALLGHNGAGKSTTLKCLTGMIPYDSGTIEICGHSIKSDPVWAKKNFGFVSDNHAVFEKMTGREYLNFMADIYGVSENDRIKRILYLQDIFALSKAINYIISSYSHGMKQKICLMGSVIHEPDLWVLDEPLTGLDAVIVKSLKNYIVEYAKGGKAVIFSTHLLDFVEKICTRAIIIKDGHLQCDINIKDLSDSGKSFEEFALEHIGG